MNGSVYRVCGKCRNRRDEEAAQYLDSFGDDAGFDDMDDSEFDIDFEDDNLDDLAE